MSYEDFKLVLSKQREFEKFIDDAYHMGIDLTNADALSFTDLFLKLICKLAYPKDSDDAYDMLSWYIYEFPDLQRRYPNESHLDDADGNPIDISTDEKFYEYMKKEYA